MNKLPCMLLLLAPLAVACSGEDDDGTTTGGDDDISAILALDGDATAGETVYADTCAASNCHGPNGEGTNASAALPDVVPGMSDEALATLIKFGNLEDGGTMPAVLDGNEPLTDQQIADVLVYVTQEFN